MRRAKQKIKTEKAVFGAGCFWHVEASFRKVHGVINTAVGYMGGHTKNPSYGDVCTDKTGHLEVCLFEFDPKRISYNELLEVFWGIHDPAQLNRQGLDIGSQYQSIIFYYGETQKRLAIESKKKKQKKYKQPIVTRIVKAGEFYKAEGYHQRYLEKKKLAGCG